MAKALNSYSYLLRDKKIKQVKTAEKREAKKIRQLKSIENRMERIRFAMMHNRLEELPAKDFQHATRLKLAYPIVCNPDIPENKKMRMIEETLGVVKSVARKIKLDTQELILDAHTISKDLQRILLVQRYEQIYKTAMENEELELAKNILDSIAKTQGLNEHTQSLIEWHKIQLPAIELSNDVKLLGAEDAEIIE